MSGTDDNVGIPVRLAIAALLGTTVLVTAGIGASIWAATPEEPDGPPNAQFDVEEATTNLTVEGERIEVRTVTFRHDGGEAIDASNLDILVSKENETRPWRGLNADGTSATFDDATVTMGSEVTTVAGAPDGGPNVSFATEVDGGERHLTDGDGTVIELQPGDTVSIVWSSDERAATVARINIE
ncbi:type IV pilin [Natronomonas halophila]|uniref:type IV pilin n=1 Tax=Natronomonas halophila TaxID=2747817 RepID=UPI0015B54B06|nr:type IV pilin [Natronomonas halophila]QLD85977.1 type IV pilin [Natronomonas halophila]